MAPSRVDFPKGFSRKLLAPAPNAWARKHSSSVALIKTMGIRRLAPARRSCKPRPFIPGNTTSMTRQSKSLRWSDCKNSSAEANASAVQLCALTTFLSDFRTDSSSSTIQPPVGQAHP